MVQYCFMSTETMRLLRTAQGGHLNSHPTPELWVIILLLLLCWLMSSDVAVDIFGTSGDQCRGMVQYSFTSMETRRLTLGRTDQDGHLDSHTAPELRVTGYPVRIRPNTPPPPHAPSMLGCTFQRLIKLTYIFVILAFVFSKSCNDLESYN